jgi:hypothetical protein
MIKGYMPLANWEGIARQVAHNAGHEDERGVAGNLFSQLRERANVGRDDEAERRARIGKVSGRNSFYFRFWEAAVGGEVRSAWAGSASSRETLLCTFHPAFFSIGSRTTVRRSITPAHLGRKA